MKLTDHNLVRLSTKVENGQVVYFSDPYGGYVTLHSAAELFEKYQQAVHTIRLMSQANDVETVRAIAAVALP